MTQVNYIKVEVIEVYDSIKKEFLKGTSRFNASGPLVSKGNSKFEILLLEIFSLKYKK